jgi:hypothetical protein
VPETNQGDLEQILKAVKDGTAAEEMTNAEKPEADEVSGKARTRFLRDGIPRKAVATELCSLVPPAPVTCGQPMHVQSSSQSPKK